MSKDTNFEPNKRNHTFSSVLLRRLSAIKCSNMHHKHMDKHYVLSYVHLRTKIMLKMNMLNALNFTYATSITDKTIGLF